MKKRNGFLRWKTPFPEETLIWFVIYSNHCLDYKYLYNNNRLPLVLWLSNGMCIWPVTSSATTWYWCDSLVDFIAGVEKTCPIFSSLSCECVGYIIFMELVCLRNHLPGRQMRICFAVVFFVFCFLFFFHPPKLWDNRSRERLNGFSWNFHQTMGGGCSLKRRAAAWRKSCRRLANGECWCFA